MTDEEKTNTMKGKAAQWKRLVKSFFSRPSSINDVTEILQSAQHESIIDAGVLHIMEGALKVSDLQTREIMIPRSQMVSLQDDKILDELLDIVINSQHSRFPVVGESSDDVSGILLAKELLPLLLYGKETFDLRSLLRPATIIPESKPIDALLKEFREHRYHMAIVVDEYGGVSGLVTIEDILEEIVGEIEDETDEQERDPIQGKGDGVFAVEAITDIDTFNEFFDIGFSDEEFDTVGGLIVQKFGRLPKVGESISFHGFGFTVTACDQRKVISVDVRKQPI